MFRLNHSHFTSFARLIFGLAILTLSGVALGQGVASPYSAAARPTLSEEFGEDAEHYLDPSDFALDARGEYFYVACSGSSQLLRAKADGSESGTTLDLPFSPTAVRLFPDGSQLAVVGGGERGMIALVDLSGASPTLGKTSRLGHTPTGLAVKGIGADARIYASNRFDGTVVELDGTTLDVLRTWACGREPGAIELTPNGGKLVVANKITDMQANLSYTFAKVRIIDLESGEVKVVDLLNGNNLLQDVAIESEGRYAFIPCVLCSYTSITSQVSGGWISENCVLCVDVEKAQLVEIFFLDDAELGSGNPWGVACSDDGERLIVSIAGTDELIYLPLKRLIQMVDERPEWARPGYGAYSYQTFAKGEVQLPFRIRAKFGFKGMRRLVARGDDVYALARFDDVLCKATLKLSPPYKHFPDAYVFAEKPPITLAAQERAAEDDVARGDDVRAEEEAYAARAKDAADGETAPLTFVPLVPRVPLEGVEIERSFARLAPKPVLTMRRRGEIAFHDATACLESWLSCVTCHPDARADGFNWDLLNDGTGTLKNTKSMLLAHETPPCMISGIRADAETAVRAGFTHILFMNYKEETANCVDE
ncbi:MAG: hypothetical protein II655_07470, partial [Thermoguttaceae bacterium]|nr:hypothetical protein [Thermoguttaceae bacterium]